VKGRPNRDMSEFQKELKGGMPCAHDMGKDGKGWSTMWKRRKKIKEVYFKKNKLFNEKKRGKSPLATHREKKKKKRGGIRTEISSPEKNNVCYGFGQKKPLASGKKRDE